MKLNAFSYSVHSGVKNLFHKKLFALASIATIAASIFLFCMFFAIIENVQHTAKEAETTVGITVLFQDDAADSAVQAVGDAIKARPEVKSVTYTSAEEAWDSFKEDYFQDNAYLAAAFAEDNPLAGSQSYEVFLTNLDDQDEFVTWLKTYPVVRQVNYSNEAVKTLQRLNEVISAVSMLIIGVLLAVSVFLISNTISVAAAFRRRENEIMKMIGATNFMIRLPFLVEGVLLGLFGAVIPLIGIYFLYQKAYTYILVHFVGLSSLSVPIPLAPLFPALPAAAPTFALGFGFIVSVFTIQKALRV